MLLTIAAPASVSQVRVRAFDRDWPAFRDQGGEWRSLVGIDLDTKPGRYEADIETGAERTTHPLAVERRTFPTRRLTVDPDLVHPPPEAQARVEREARELHEIWDHPAPERLWASPFVRPVPDEANSAFGTRSIYNGEARPPHTGADFLSPSGRPVKAPNAGRIVLAAPQYFSGNTVIIDHGLGLFSLLAHLSEIDVKAGETVAAGEVVGKVGATGRVTGPHLHWSVRLNNARVDPLSLLYALGEPRSQPNGVQEMTDSQVLDLFRHSGALLEGHYLLSSGLHSDRYLQSALVLQHPDFAEQLGRAIAGRTVHLQATAVLSPALGGIVIGQEVGRALHVRALFAERQDGTLTLRRGFTLGPSDRVLVVEDVITTGGSTRETIAVAEAAGARVLGAAAIIDRGGDPARLGIPFQALVKMEVPAFPPESCPLCRNGIPVVKPGSRA